MDFPARRVTWVISLASILAFIFRTLSDLCFQIASFSCHAKSSWGKQNFRRARYPYWATRLQQRRQFQFRRGEANDHRIYIALHYLPTSFLTHIRRCQSQIVLLLLGCKAGLSWSFEHLVQKALGTECTKKGWWASLRFEIWVPTKTYLHWGPRLTRTASLNFAPKAEPGLSWNCKAVKPPLKESLPFGT